MDNMPAIDDEDVTADADEPPDHRPSNKQSKPDFHKSTIRPQTDRKESLLTIALLTSPDSENLKPEIHGSTDLSRRRSTTSNASIASTADLTSDEGLTSPDRTNTPSPPFPNTTYASFTPFALGPKIAHLPATPMVKQENKESFIAQHSNASIVPPDVNPAVEALTKKRCITFACGGRKPIPVQLATQPAPVAEAQTSNGTTEAPKRRCTIKFACQGPNPSEKSQTETAKTLQLLKTTQTLKSTELSKRQSSRSPSMTRRARPVPLPSLRSHHDSTSTVRRTSQSPVAMRSKPKYIIADEKDLQSSEATRFHEFASDQMREDDWIRKDSDIPRERLTISDTLKKENAIRQLGKEAEEEALEEDEDGEEQDDGNDSDDENEDDEENDDVTVDGSEDEASDGNETDNEAGFADSDDESDASGDYDFWLPGKSIQMKQSGEASTYRPSAHRTASTSSIDSLNHMSPSVGANDSTTRRPKPSRRIKIRPGTPDLPDSTDFVCGTLDEDRPLEDAYVSCMEARKREKHHQIPQDIDPSFPTSDPEDEENEDNIVKASNDSDENIWLHGMFEDSDEEPRHGRRRSNAMRRSPAQSPKRLHSPPPAKRLHSPPPPKRCHSPPPAKHRLRSPPPRKLFGGHTPKRLQSPPPARTIRSPAASPTLHATSGAIAFAPLGSRPGLTHTKSLPRKPNAFCRQYKASRIVVANGIATDGSDTPDGHVRGAIDIVKGLEKKRQRRKENFYQKQCNRARKGQPERRPQPGKGAERMRELGLLMAGKVGHDPYMLSA